MRRSENIIGYIIKVYPAKESDQYVHVITNKGERQTIYAKGSRKEGSRKSYAIDLLNLCSFKISGYSSGFPFLDEVKLIHNTRASLESLSALGMVQAICELTDKFCLPEQPNPSLFILVDSAVKLIKNEDNRLLVSAFILKLLDLEGALPDLSVDTISGEKILSESERIMGPEIGYLKSQIPTANVSDRIYKVQRFIVNNPFAEVLRLKLEEHEVNELVDISTRWVEYQLERPFHAKQMIAKSN